MNVLLTPLEWEYQALCQRLILHWPNPNMMAVGRRATLSYFPKGHLLVGVGGHGKVQYAIVAQHILENLESPSSLICAGAAGALLNGLNLGDVVLAERTIEHDYHLRFIKKESPNFPGEPELVARFAAFRPNGFAIHQGIIASGDEDILHDERRLEVQLATQGLAVAWEGAGAARVAKFNHLPFLEIRGLTDSANGFAIRDFQSNLNLAMKNIADLLVAGLSVKAVD